MNAISCLFGLRMTTRSRNPIPAILLFVVIACNRGATQRMASQPPAPAAGATVAPLAAAQPSTAVASGAVVFPNEPPRSVVVTGAGASDGDRAATVLDSRLFSDPQVRDVYEKAHLVADRLDRMYCYCHCHEERGHRSLLSCFQGTHAAECGICLREGYQAWLDFQAGRSVEDSQRAADAVYHQGVPPPSLPAAE
jgi:hypothetical protein